jgi:hypothetical protein
MKQLYFTSCLAGRSLSGQSGFKVRAVSSGIDSTRIDAAVKFTGYELHSSVAANESTVRVAPIRLALIDTPEIGRIFLRSCYVGKDPVTGRFANFFTHLLLDVPESIDGPQAIGCWGSPFWRSVDGDFGLDLPEVREVPRVNELNEETLAGFLGDELSRRMLTFALAAFLNGTGRIYLAAPAEEVALCAYGITRLAPTQSAGKLTFSTYESKPLTSYARLVGTCWPATSVAELPSSCYLGSGCGFNRFSGKQTPLETAGTYAEFAVNSASRSDWSRIDGVRNVVSKLGDVSGELLEAVLRIETGNADVPRDVIARLFDDPARSKWAVSRPRMIEQIVEQSAEDQAFGRKALGQVLATLSDDATNRSKLILAIAQRVAELAREPDDAKARNLLEATLTAVGPNESAVRHHVFDAVGMPDALSWEMFAYLLRHLPRADSSSGCPANLELRRLWLTPPADRIGPLLALDLPEADRIFACVETIRNDRQAWPQLVQALGAHRSLAFSVLDRLSSDTKSLSDTIRFFEAMTTEKDANAWLDAMFQRSSKQPTPLLKPCLRGALARGVLDVELLIETHGEGMVPLLDGEDLTRIVDQCLTAQSSGAATLAFLEKAAGSAAIDESRRQRIRSRASLESFLARPTLELSALSRVAEAVRGLPIDQRKAQETKILKLVVAELFRVPRKQDAGIAFEHAIEALATMDASGASEIYFRLSQELRRTFRAPWRWKLWQRPDLLSAMMGVALGNFRTASLGRLMFRLDLKTKEDLEYEAHDLAWLVARRGGPKALNALDRRIVADSWTQAAIDKWRRFRPRPDDEPPRNLIEDLIPVLGGALIMIVIIVGILFLTGRL